MTWSFTPIVLPSQLLRKVYSPALAGSRPMVVKLADVALDLLVRHAEPAQVAARLLAALGQLGFEPPLVLEDAVTTLRTTLQDASREVPDQQRQHEGEQDDPGEREPFGARVGQDHHRVRLG